jgi:hypothetical protein
MKIKLKIEVTEGDGPLDIMTHYVEHTITAGTVIISEPKYSVKPGKKRYRKIFGRRKLFPSRVRIQTGNHITFSSSNMIIMGIEVVE